ncbi:hypothetical protein tb265_50120 [Gemmatimonadetes bacterium T265]|nr:hypothetical protein tb265_50120 [Gemmatimonadetes bacterium T265]
MLAVLGVLAGVVAAAGRSATPMPADTWRAAVTAARTRALATGHRVHVSVGPAMAALAAPTAPRADAESAAAREAGPGGGRTRAAPPRDVLALPDGRVLIEPDDGARPAIDPLTGRQPVDR